MVVGCTDVGELVGVGPAVVSGPEAAGAAAVAAGSACDVSGEVDGEGVEPALVGSSPGPLEGSVAEELPAFGAAGAWAVVPEAGEDDAGEDDAGEDDAGDDDAGDAVGVGDC